MNGLFWGVTLGLAATVVLVTFRARRAVRDLWAALEALQARHWRLRDELVRMEATLGGRIANLAVRSDPPVRFHAQHGEDVLLWEFFDRKRDGFFVEVGAFDGVTLSNTHALEALGWTGILVEADPDSVEACRRGRSAVVVHAAVAGPGADATVPFYVARGAGTAALSSLAPDEHHLRRVADAGGKISVMEVPCRTITDILDEHCDRAIDVMTIDVEGGELSVLEGMDFDRYRPAVLVIENNRSEDDDQVRVRMGRHGYRLAHVLKCNEFYLEEVDERPFPAR